MKNKISMLIFLSGLSMMINTLPGEPNSDSQSIVSQDGSHRSPHLPHDKHHKHHSHHKPSDQPGDTKPHHHLHIVEKFEEVEENVKHTVTDLLHKQKKSDRPRSLSHNDVSHQSSGSLTFNQHNSPSENDYLNLSTKVYPKYNGYYTNTLNPDTSSLPMYKLVNSGQAAQNIDMIICTNTKTNEDKTILFSSNSEYKRERYIVILDNQNQHIFTIENDATESDETPQDALQRKKSVEKLKELKAALSSSSNPDNPSNPQSENQSPTQERIDTILKKLKTDSQPTSPRPQDQVNEIPQEQKVQQTPDEISIKSTAQQQYTPVKKFTPLNRKKYRYTVIGVGFFAACCILAYKYNAAFAKLLDTIYAQCSNLIPRYSQH
jgi:hypothetical protein